jgi:hypothetical protein
MKRFLFMPLFICSFISISAQEITVKSMTKLENDLAARRNEVLDNNGVPCALIRILVPMVKGMQFTGIKGEAKYLPGEYDVYIPQGSKRIRFRHEKYPAGTIEFSIPIEKLCVYQIILNVPNLSESYDELISIAKEYYNNYPAHTESSYFDAARLAYDKVIEHNDCPQDMRDAIRAERDTMASLRRNTYLIEAAEAKAKQFEKEKGFNSDEVYKYLSGELRFTNRILSSHPEITGVKDIKDNVLARLQNHPKGQNIVETTVTKQRETISGTISFKNKYMAIPFQNMHVFATSSPNIKDGQSRKIANVKADGTYSAVKPDGINPLYIYVTGEKDDAHYVSQGTTSMDIIVK